MSEQTTAEKMTDLVAMKQELSPAIAKMVKLEKELKAELMESGDTPPIVEGLTVTMKAGYSRAGWDSKALEELALIIPEVLECKKPTAVKATVAFKFL